MLPKLVVAAVVLLWTQGGASDDQPLYRTTWDATAGSYGTLHVTLREEGEPPPALALSVGVDGREDHVIVVTTGVGRTEYASIVGPLSAGRHTLELRRSRLWPAAGSVAVTKAILQPIDPSDPRAAVLAHAPALGLRTDTIGTANDLPLLMYVEDARTRGDGWLRYSVIFSNEDGGTPAIALMARWGRTTDIELISEVELRAGRVTQARYQGPDHRMLVPTTIDARPPRLNVITLNNMVVDRGAPAAAVRLLPDAVELTGRSREQVMDGHPWIYRAMARELARERPPGVSDPRDFLYVDLNIERVRGAAVSAAARSAAGPTRWSDRGRSDLAIARTGDVRIAVPLPAGESLDSLTIRCDARPAPSDPALEAECHVSLRQAVRLSDDYQPAPLAVAPRTVALPAGTSRDFAVMVPASAPR